MSMPKQIKDMTIVELKAHIFDLESEKAFCLQVLQTKLSEPQPNRPEMPPRKPEVTPEPKK